MKSKFRGLVEKIIHYRKLLTTLGLNNLVEDKDDNQTYLAMAYGYYKSLLKKIENKQYTITQSGALRIPVADFVVYLDVGKNGSYNHNHYDEDYECLHVYTQDLQNIKKDFIFKSNFVHELTHHFTEVEDLDMTYDDYIKPEDNELQYYTQPRELLSNKIAISDHIIGIIKDNIRGNIKEPDIKDRNSIENFIKGILGKIIQSKGFLYYNFLQALSKDRKQFLDFYNEIVDTCVEYIQNNLHECTQYAIYHTIQETAGQKHSEEKDEIQMLLIDNK